MTASVIDGRAVARGVRAETARRAAALTAAPVLATVLVGDDPASGVYVASKRKAAVAAGIGDVHRHLPGTTAESEVAAVLDELAADDGITGILLQLPLPGHLEAARLVERIPPEKDVDGLTIHNQGLLARGEPGLRPCTPAGVIALLDAGGIGLAGSHAVVVGRSTLVGRPRAQLLLGRDATVTVAHSRTRDLPAVTRAADVLVAAVGVPGIITRAHVAPGAAVIDVGIHRTATGLVGDVDQADVAPVAGALTPVPGGVGPMTIAMLLANTVTAAESRVSGR
ncbi:bifunctional 5,10-methylenetetrahydrofolate dehydrogenase/5,10-methenyltetrahydrofolate cyclohydrolase [Pseudonocardia sp. ICBG1293]|uniref:bifunctional 5,10-methylenetetrahydrofolate dehydrogenase/5,10-methenyltetrahydrofolate cyclohydrolase n=1 Tax=Pseudonocardia sp. ICBG1293 TaxID=2844382 RepID=UPI001CCD9B80|nr:bifunctional 5,10-methylenetetrahydrofolate dehydrogenase/5,10-methenyltetrahydrofolate cyclohydrolase [Pseudonocardia sp. ICBG1293]